jgi:hypothetical protein
VVVSFRCVVMVRCDGDRPPVVHRS